MIEIKALTGARYPVLGAGGPRFESGRPDHISCHFIRLAIIALIGQCIFFLHPLSMRGIEWGTTNRLR